MSTDSGRSPSAEFLASFRRGNLPTANIEKGDKIFKRLEDINQNIINKWTDSGSLIVELMEKWVMSSDSIFYACPHFGVHFRPECQYNGIKMGQPYHATFLKLALTTSINEQQYSRLSAENKKLELSTAIRNRHPRCLHKGDRRRRTESPKSFLEALSRLFEEGDVFKMFLSKDPGLLITVAACLNPNEYKSLRDFVAKC
jgi:hypothetical protein